MFRTTPICASCISVALPPAEKKGSEIPVVGIELVTTAILSSAWIPNWNTTPITTIELNLSGARMAIESPLATKRTNSKMMASAPISPNSSQMMAKIKSFCGSDTQRNFWVEFPSPTPNSPPLPIA